MPCSSIYCINNTGLVGADDTYITGGTYNGYTYWSGQTNGWVIFYSTGTTSQWCLSNTFSGTCSLAGKTPCFSSCPDLSTAYVYSGVCPTPTPTPTNNCSVLDFNAVFDCEFIPTPTITPTSTITPTPTITPTATNPCSIIGIDAIAYRTPQTLPLMVENNVPLQSFEPLTILNCGVSGDVTFNLINDDIICSSIRIFQNCFDSELFYCSNVTLLPGQSLELFQVYQGLVDNELKCISYIGDGNNNVDINTNQIIINTISFGNLNEGKCILCEDYVPPSPTPTPTETPTPTPTPTLTATPTITPTKTLTPTPTPTQTSCIPEMIYNGEEFSNLIVQNGMSFKSDGTILYVTGHNNSPEDSVCAYSLLTPWNVSTISPSTPIACSIGTPVSPSANYGQYFSPNGSNLFLANSSYNSILKYTLSTPWDVSTSSYSPGDLFSTGVSSSPEYIDFSPNGLFMFVRVSGGLLKRYTLTTSWIINIGVTETQSISFGNSYDFTFQNNGYYLFSLITISGALNIRKHTLSIPYDLTSIVLTETNDVSSFIPLGNFYSINFKDGYKGFIGSYENPTPNSIYAFELVCEYDINGPIVLPLP